jgi:hypothetical protein
MTGTCYNAPALGDRVRVAPPRKREDLTAPPGDEAADQASDRVVSKYLRARHCQARDVRGLNGRRGPA